MQPAVTVNFQTLGMCSKRTLTMLNGYSVKQQSSLCLLHCPIVFMSCYRIWSSNTSLFGLKYCSVELQCKKRLLQIPIENIFGASTTVIGDKVLPY